ncbi:PTS sugar transporter subunit IIA [Lapidilactobacillus luobeiensis]|uniref:PTS sugar transporter subunit IIA n=1 Tax=Lapidilactobacillus luobeiensis TaxID=2950371 RepID=UPI0021C3FAC4|nr:PTS glucose transporter subunit IIA [Lapidilactobacillus luobeiensis]
MLHFKKKEQVHTDEIFAPVTGQVIELSTVSDPVFAQKMMGEGFAIMPDADESAVVAPVSGEVIIAQGHAFGIRRDDGLEFLVHVGIDTVALKGAPFKVHVKQGKQVVSGEKIITVDWSQIEAAQLDKTVMVLITNSKTNLAALNVDYQHVSLGDLLGKASAKA